MDTLQSLNYKQYRASQINANARVSGFDKVAFAIRIFYSQAFKADKKSNTVWRDQLLTFTGSNF